MARPFLDPKAKRVTLCCRVSPETMEIILNESKDKDVSQGKVVDQLADKFKNENVEAKTD